MKKLIMLLSLATFSISLLANDCDEHCLPSELLISPMSSSVGNLKSLMTEVKLANDTREIFGRNSPAFLESYGRIFVTLKNGKRSACTGNIVTNEPEYDEGISSSNSIVTSAAHCFEAKNIDEIYIIFTKRDGRKYRRDLELLESDRYYDYAILKMDKPVPTSLIEPLIVTTYEAEDLKDIAEMDDEEITVTAGGYSADIFKGNRGKNLTYDQQCEIQSETRRGLHTDCITYSGASGGAIVLSAFNDGGTHYNYFMGVLQGAPGGYDKPDRAIYAPTYSFIDSLMWEIEKSNK